MSLRYGMLMVVLIFVTLESERAISAPPAARQRFTVHVPGKAAVTQISTAGETQITVTATADLWMHFQTATVGMQKVGIHAASVPRPGVQKSDRSSKSWGQHILARKPVTISIPHPKSGDQVTVLTVSGF